MLDAQTDRRSPYRDRNSIGVVLLAASMPALGQSPTPQQTDPPTPATSSAAPTPQSPASAAPADDSASVHADTEANKNPVLIAGAFSIKTIGGEIKEEDLKQLLVGKALYLRAGYQDNNLEFDELGRLTGHSPKGSFTLSQIQVNKIKLSRRKLELEGDRYGLHFLGAAPFEDPTKATDRVKITPKKKTVRISFDREQVEKPKKEKHKHKHKNQDEADSKASGKPSTDPDAPFSAAPAEKPADHKNSDKTTKTTDPSHASQLLLTAIDTVLSRGIDDRMIAAMPDFWKLYYKAAAEKTDYRPTETGVFFQNAVDQKARLISALDAPSNEFAQSNGVAGMALYHAVVGMDGKVEQVVAGRPIGFGLDENAEQTIRKAAFQPATKDGKPVPVAIDLVVSFRIFSKRTSQMTANEAKASDDKPALPGPYTLSALKQNQASQQNQPAPQDQAAQPTKTPQ